MIFDHLVAIHADSITAGEHKHGALQLSVSLDGRPHLVGPTEAARRPALVHLVGSQRAHAFHGVDGCQLLVWIAPESALGHELARRYLAADGFAALPDSITAGLPMTELSAVFASGTDGAEVAGLIDRWMSAIVGSPLEMSTELHPSIRRAAEILHSLDVKRISAQELASEVGLSVSRFQYLFSRGMGTPLRPHLQWLRILDALIRIVDGESVTDAAANAGFADAPHLNRVMQQYFGFTPGDLVRRPDMTVELHLTGRR